MYLKQWTKGSDLWTEQEPIKTVILQLFIKQDQLC